MATYLKKSIQKTEASDGKTKDIVKRILRDIRSRGESAVCEMAAKFDNWSRDFILTKEEINRILISCPHPLREIFVLLMIRFMALPSNSGKV